MKEIWTTMAAIMGVWAFFQSLLQTMFPPELRFASLKLVHRLRTHFSSHCCYDITEIDGVNTNELYSAVHLYLSSSASISGSRLSLARAVNSSSITFALSNNDRLTDSYGGATIEWEHVVTPRQSPNSFTWRPLPEEKRGFILRVRKNNKHIVLNSYLDHVMEKAAEIRRRSEDRLLYTNSRGHPWESVPFKHPSTFDTLAMDPLKKAAIMADLRDFAEGESFYQKTGRAWKRGYLLYGPPGTGKSSMIAAMANYLRYDIYDLELTEVNTNSELRKLLMKTTSKSIIVIEDIDCSINLTTNRNKSVGFGGGYGCFGSVRNNNYLNNNDIMSVGVGPNGDESGNMMTLSGLLNFTDGLWSCCGSERIFVFTTNHIEKLDPALLRCGRMDMHVHMSYCTLPALKILLRNYLCDEECGVERELSEVIGAAEMTPADVSEILIKNRRDKNKAVGELVEAMRVRAGERSGMKSPGNEYNCKVEDEEFEKRALDSPIEGSDDDDELQGSCKFEDNDGCCNKDEHGDEIH